MKLRRSVTSPAKQPAPEKTFQELDSQQLLKATLDSSFNFIQVFQAQRDLSGTIIDFSWVLTNRRWQETYGDVIGKSLLAQNPAVVETGIFARMVAVTQTGIPQTHEQYYPYEQFDGWFDQTYVKLNDGVVLTAEDITERKRSEQAERRQEELYRTLIEQAPVATALFVGPELRLEVANSLMIDFFGKGPAIVGQPIRVILNQPNDAYAVALLDQVFTSGQPYVAQAAPAQLVIHGVAGTYYFDFSLKPLVNSAGEVYAVLQTAVDVTPQVLARRQTDQTQQALQHAVDLAELGTWYLDVLSGRVSCSERINAWMGLGKQLLMEKAADAVEPPEAARIGTAYRHALTPTSGGHMDVEFSMANLQTGQPRIVHVVGQTQFDEQGRPVSMSGFAQDVTRQRALQAELERLVDERTHELQIVNHDLQRSNDNLQQFAYVASHDLQEPLRKIQSFSTLLAQQLNGELGESANDYLQRITVASTRMSTLIKDLLTYSRISTRQQTYGTVSLNAIMAGVLSTLDWEIGRTGAQISIEELPDMQGDESQLSQLFQNLLTNAIKFVLPGQFPRVCVRYFHRSLSELPVEVRPATQVPFYHQISVQDEGIGFDTRFLDRIFQVFQRLHGKHEFPGTGVGLAICQRVVENHGGAITANSQPGQGATFSVYLPD